MHRKTTVLKSLFNERPMNVAKFLRAPTLKNINERRLRENEVFPTLMRNFLFFSFLTANFSKTTLRKLLIFCQGTFIILYFVKTWVKRSKSIRPCVPLSDKSGQGTLTVSY